MSDSMTARPQSVKPHQSEIEINSIKNVVRFRDGERCTMCGLSNDAHLAASGKQLEVHRIDPGQPYAIDSCVTLCRACHGPQAKESGLVKGVWVDRSNSKHPMAAMRQQRGLSRRRLAELSGVGEGRIERRERGELRDGLTDLESSAIVAVLRERHVSAALPEITLFVPDEPRPSAHYVARCGEDAIDEGGPLAPFLANLLASFPSLECDLVIWIEGGVVPPRAVCVIRPGVMENVVTWL